MCRFSAIGPAERHIIDGMTEAIDRHARLAIQAASSVITRDTRTTLTGWLS